MFQLVLNTGRGSFRDPGWSLTIASSLLSALLLCLFATIACLDTPRRLSLRITRLRSPQMPESHNRVAAVKGGLKSLIRFLSVIGKGYDSIWQYVRPDHEARSKGNNHQHNG